MMVFNNGLGRNYSTVDEWTPPVDMTGNYARAAGEAFGPGDFTWTYKADPPSSLYSDAISSAQRLPNGNTLICDGVHGVFLEVTPLGETVWKYINPVVRTGPLAQGSDIPPDPARQGEYMNAVFKVHRYAPDYPGMIGRDLTSKGTVEQSHLWQFMPGDFDGDGDVDAIDFAILAEHWLQSDSSFHFGAGGMDLTNDGFINFEDLMIFTEGWLHEQ